MLYNKIARDASHFAGVNPQNKEMAEYCAGILARYEAFARLSALFNDCAVNYDCGAQLLFDHAAPNGETAESGADECAQALECLGLDFEVTKDYRGNVVYELDDTPAAIIERLREELLDVLDISYCPDSRGDGTYFAQILFTCGGPHCYAYKLPDWENYTIRAAHGTGTEFEIDDYNGYLNAFFFDYFAVWGA